MKISEYAVKNYQFTLIMFIMVAVLGVTTILNMPRSEDPDIKAPNFPIVAVYPGASPKDMEELVVKPIEKKIYALDDIKEIKTTIKDGLAVIAVESKYAANVDDKYQELVREVNALRSSLPADLFSLEVQKISPTDVNVLQVGLVSMNASREKLQKAAEDLQERLEKIPFLKNVEIAGMPGRLVRIDLDPAKLAQLRLPIGTVSNAIQSELANIPGGSINQGTKSFNIKTSGNYESLEEIKATVVASAGGKNVQLGDVADVYFDYAPETHITRLNGYRSAFVVAAQKPGENISRTQEAYLPVIEDFKKTLPANIDLKLSFDQADNVNNRLSGLGTYFLIAILLVSVTLLPLGLRAATVVMISIPLSLAIGIVIINVLGFDLNQLSIVGLVVALGLLVDDSIVVVENIERWLRDGHSRMNATLMATKQIGVAVIGCTATLMIAFMPLLFLPEASGDFIRSLPAAVIACIIASMVVALTVVPFLSSRLLKSHAGHPEGNLFLRAFKRGIHKTYAPLLNVALKHPVMTVLAAILIFAGSMALFPVVGFSLFPQSEKPQFLINIVTPLQSNLAYTDSVTRKIEKELAAVPEMRYFATNVGKGNPRIYYNVIQQNERSDFAEIFVQLDPGTGTDRKQAIVESLRQKWTPYPGAKIEVKNFEQGPPVIAPVEVRLLGDNLDTLRRLAVDLEQMLNRTPGTIYVNNPVRNLKSDIKVDINKEKALSLGIPTVNIDRTVRLAVAGLTLGKFTNPDAGGDDYDILLSVPRPMYPDFNVLKTLYINNLEGTAVPLAQLADFRLQTSPLTINHYNKTRTVSVTAFVKKGYLTDRVVSDVQTRLEGYKLPAGYSFEMGGEVESRQRSFGGFGSIIIVTVFLFVAVLVLEFKTFKSTLIVLSVIPLGIVGAVLSLLITGNTLSFVAVVGMIALAGIEVKNTILLVDFTNQLRQEGMSLDEAIREAGEVRFLPIILTTLTAIGGLIPIAISTNPLISPLAIVMIGGLISSTLLSRVVTPVIYKLMPPAVAAPDQATGM
ncbi:efflux RND transporter permease subunit [Pedobacter sp. SYP-B3415]|uniref:efflux RND transporter permease subunit n=1 Tax=Pedobacter sp. SYP-B3415 TaxID=2496641 RepID=UPI00101CA8F9|nr:efflux RND transporter permease subunit [Pedobacter sp. SYP-B3415]